MSFILLGILNSQAGGAAQYYWAYSWYEGNLTRNQHIVEDSSGNIFWSSMGNSPYPSRNVSVEADGTLRWFRQVTGATLGKFFGGSTQAVDSSDNFYTAGWALGGGSTSYIFKYNNSGSLVWQRQLSENELAATQIAVDSSDNLYVCGGAGSAGRGYLAKLNSDGTINWQVEIGSSNTDYIISMDFDSSGNIYALMREDSTAVDTCATLVKYNSSGVVQWQRYYFDTEELATLVRVAPSGNIYTVGWTYPSGAGTAVGIVTKWNSSGTVQWQKSITAANGYCNAHGVDLDADENVYITTEALANPGGRFSAGIIKLDSSGTTQWIREFADSVGSCKAQGNLKIHSSGVMLIGFDSGYYGEGALWSLPVDGSLTGSTHRRATWQAATNFTIGTLSYTSGTSSLGTGTAGISSAASALTDAAYSPTTYFTTL